MSNTLTTERQALIKRMANALYDYSVMSSQSTWNGKRPGLAKPKTPNVYWASCGGYRAWTIHAVTENIAFSMDGFAHRRGDTTGSVRVLVGNGNFIFPHDDSRTYHPMHLQASDGSKLINVTREPIEWEPYIEAMAESLENAANQLQANIEAYDEAARQQREMQHKQDLQEAASALASKGGAQ